jgi:hypothetical protein
LSLAAVAADHATKAVAVPVVSELRQLFQLQM